MNHQIAREGRVAGQVDAISTFDSGRLPPVLAVLLQVIGNSFANEGDLRFEPNLKTVPMRSSSKLSSVMLPADVPPRGGMLQHVDDVSQAVADRQ